MPQRDRKKPNKLKQLLHKWRTNEYLILTVILVLFSYVIYDLATSEPKKGSKHMKIHPPIVRPKTLTF